MRNLVRDAIATEAIAFQSGVFFKEVVNYLEEIKRLDRKALATDKQAMAKLSKIVAHHTGATVEIVFIPDEGAYTLQYLMVGTPSLDKNHPLVNDQFRPFQETERDKNVEAGLNKGTVNLATGKIGGVYSKLPSTIFVPLAFFSHGGFTVEEFAALFLHEVGHVFVYFEHMTRMATTNYVLQEIARNMETSNTPEAREHVLVWAKDLLKLPELDVRKLSTYTDKTTVEVAVFGQAVKKSISELGSSVYDSNNFEQLADQFVTRHGAYKELVTGLDKLLVMYGEDVRVSTTAHIVGQTFRVILALSVVGLPLAIILSMCDGAGSTTYDRPGVRMTRVRNQLIERLKDNKLPKEQVEMLSKDLEAIDAVLVGVKDRLNVLDLIAKYFSKSRRQRFEAEEFQNDLERIANNDLFFKAAKLRTFG